MGNRIPLRGTGKRNQVLKPSRIMTPDRPKNGEMLEKTEKTLLPQGTKPNTLAKVKLQGNTTWGKACMGNRGPNHQ